MNKREKALREKERQLDQRENELKKREMALDKREAGPITQAIQEKKEYWYDKVPLNVHQLDIIIYIAVGALILVFVLIILEATGIFKIGG